MRIRYGRAVYGLAAAFAVTTTLSLSAAGVANAAAPKAKPDLTPACTFQSYCSDPVFNVEFGIQYFINNNNSRWDPGNGINLAYANDNNPGQDWTVDLQGSVRRLYHLGYISSAMQVHYRHSFAVEVMWTPYGVLTNLCRGIARTAWNGEKVTLQPCGDFPNTLWIVGSNQYAAMKSQARPDKTAYYGGNELITAATSNPSVPYVLTAGGSLFGGNPFAQLRVYEQTANNGVVNPGQLWCTASVNYNTQNGPPPVSPPQYKSNSPYCFGSINDNIG